MVLWGYTFRLTAYFCRAADSAPIGKLLTMQIFVWVMAAILLGSMTYISNYGDGSRASFVRWAVLVVWMINYDVCCFACKRVFGLRRPQQEESDSAQDLLHDSSKCE